MPKFKRRGYARPAKATKKDKKQDRQIATIKRMLQPEIKVGSGTQGATLVPDTGGISANYLVFSQGAASNQRLGSQMRIVGYEVQWLIRNTNSNSPQAAVLAAIIDRKVNGTLCTASQLQQTTGANSYKSAYNIDNVGGKVCPYAKGVLNDKGVDRVKRFKVLKEKRVEIPIFSAVGQGSPNYMRGTWRFKLNLVQTYQSSGGTIADIVDNMPYFIYWGQNDNAGPSVNGIFVEYMIAVFFTDM